MQPLYLGKSNKKLSYRLGTARCVVSVEILPIATQQCRDYLYDNRLELATINLQTKFEVSNYTRYKDMRSSAKCTNWGSLRHLGGTQGHRQCHYSIESIRQTDRQSDNILLWL